MRTVLLLLVVLVAAFVGLLWVLGSGTLGEDWGGGTPVQAQIPEAAIEARTEAQLEAAGGVGTRHPRQILFGDLHVHSTFSTDAFMMSLPMAGGDGAHPVADACDFARHCSALDFWSINDHALALTPRRWAETVATMRQCDAVAGDPQQPDVTPFLGWEWTQVGTNPDDHYGHKNVVLRHMEDGRIPARPIAAGMPAGTTAQLPHPVVWGLLPLFEGQDGIDTVRYLREMLSAPDCPAGVAVRDLPVDCIERAPSPDLLFEKLADWGHESLVIPHGTTWGYYTPAGSAWDKQLTPAMHDPQRQRLIEVFSGHGNSEEFRPFVSAVLGPDGSASCPEPSEGYVPSCWRAGEIIEQRCLDAGEAAETCAGRAAEARDLYLAAGVSGHHTITGESAADWGQAGQCQDCFLPSFNYRPKSSAQYILALSREAPEGGDPLRFRLGFMASSDNHSARPGTGYKEYGRKDMTEMRFRAFETGALGWKDTRPAEPRAIPYEQGETSQFFGLLETERQASFFLTGGLVAVHAGGRHRDAIWNAMQRKEVYGTSGPRMLLWFDLLNGPGTRGAVLPMGSQTRMDQSPIFQVRAVGSFEQKPGCPDWAEAGLGPERLARLCQGECYHPSDRRRQITRIEVVRIRPQTHPEEEIAGLIEDPWQVFACEPDEAGCLVTFSDPDFEVDGRDSVYYVRAIEAPSPAVNADMVGCLDVPIEDDCLGEVEERAWSSPIFIDHTSPTLAAAAP